MRNPSESLPEIPVVDLDDGRPAVLVVAQGERMAALLAAARRDFTLPLLIAGDAAQEIARDMPDLKAELVIDPRQVAEVCRAWLDDHGQLSQLDATVRGLKENVLRLAGEQGLSVEDVAEKSNTPLELTRKVFAGTGNPCLGTVGRFAKVLGVRPETLIERATAPSDV